MASHSTYSGCHLINCIVFWCLVERLKITDLQQTIETLIEFLSSLSAPAKSYFTKINLYQFHLVRKVCQMYIKARNRFLLRRMIKMTSVISEHLLSGTVIAESSKA